MEFSGKDNDYINWKNEAIRRLEKARDLNIGDEIQTRAVYKAVAIAHAKLGDLTTLTCDSSMPGGKRFIFSELEFHYQKSFHKFDCHSKFISFPLKLKEGSMVKNTVKNYETIFENAVKAGNKLDEESAIMTIIEKMNLGEETTSNLLESLRLKMNFCELKLRINSSYSMRKVGPQENDSANYFGSWSWKTRGNRNYDRSDWKQNGWSSNGWSSGGGQNNNYNNSNKKGSYSKNGKGQSGGSYGDSSYNKPDYQSKGKTDGQKKGKGKGKKGKGKKSSCFYCNSCDHYEADCNAKKWDDAKKEEEERANKMEEAKFFAKVLKEEFSREETGLFVGESFAEEANLMHLETGDRHIAIMDPGATGNITSDAWIREHMIRMRGLGDCRTVKDVDEIPRKYTIANNKSVTSQRRVQVPIRVENCPEFLDFDLFGFSAPTLVGRRAHKKLCLSINHEKDEYSSRKLGFSNRPLAENNSGHHIINLSCGDGSSEKSRNSSKNSYILSLLRMKNSRQADAETPAKSLSFTDQPRNYSKLYESMMFKATGDVEMKNDEGFLLADENYDFEVITEEKVLVAIEKVSRHKLANSLGKEMIRKLHENFGHPPAQTLMKLLSKQKRYRFEKAHVFEVVAECIACQHVNLRERRSVRPASGVVAERFNQIVHMDLTEIEGEVVAVMVDALSGLVYAELIEKKSDCDITLMNWIDRYGVPETIVTDCGGEFMKDFSDLLDSYNIRHRTTSARTPWSNGKAERKNK